MINTTGRIDKELTCFPDSEKINDPFLQELIRHLMKKYSSAIDRVKYFISRVFIFIARIGENLER